MESQPGQQNEYEQENTFSGASAGTGEQQRNKLYAFLTATREWIANWQMPCSNRLVRYWLDKFNDRISDPKSQRRVVLIIVCIALFLDNMLYMVIVPIIPTYLRSIHAFPVHIEYENVTVFDNTTTTLTPPIPTTTIPGQVMTTPTTEANNTFIRSFKMMARTYQSKNEDVNIGVLFACKAIFQLFINPFTGTLMDRIGYDIPMMIGLSIIFVSTSMFAIGKSYGALFVARSMQGIGSAFADTSGLAMIADRFPDDKERSAALGIALAFISFGSLVAPPFGGTLYEFAGKAIPFIILALIALFDGTLMMFAMKPVRKERKDLKKKDKLPNATPIYKLIADPYIALCAGCLVMANVSLAFIEPTIALWMKDEMGSPEWQIGLIWLPAFIPHIVGVFLTVKIAGNYPQMQWLIAAIGLAMEGISCMILPFCKQYGLVILPLCILCFGIALVDTAILPLMAHLVDVRHVSVYGSVYAIADISYSAAYAVGPIIAGQIVNSIGFTALNAGIFVSNIIYAPMLIFLRKAYDYERFEPETEAIIGIIDPDHKMYKSFTASYEDQNEALNLWEQTPVSKTNGVTISYKREESDDESDEDAVFTEKTALKAVIHRDTNHTSVEDVRRMTGYGYDDGCKKPPVPRPRRPSVDQVPDTERVSVNGNNDAESSDDDAASESESDY